MAQKFKLFTVGHSNQTQDEFLHLLRENDINCIVDVRSVPASKYASQFNEDILRWFLKYNGIHYLHFGEEFGARRYDCLNEDGQVDFELAIQTPAFLHGVQRIIKGLESGYHIALMCSEANPLECHRFSFLSRYFHEHGFDVQHILKDAVVVPTTTLEHVMIEEYKKSRKHHLPDTNDLFGSYTVEDQLRDAYRLKNKEIGYRPASQEENIYT